MLGKTIASGFVFALMLSAQTAVMPLSLKQAVDIALTKDGNARAQIAKELIVQAQSRSAQARAALLPNLDSYLSYSNQTRNLAAVGIQFNIPVPGFSVPELVGPFNVMDLRATATQSVFDFSAIRRYQAARVGVEAVKYDDENTRNQVADQVTRAYLSSLRAQATVETTKANLELADRLYRLAVSQKEAGTGTGIEVTRAQVQVTLARQQLIAAEYERDRASYLLLRAMNLKLETTVQLTDSMRFVEPPPTSLAKEMETANTVRPDLKAQLKREENSKLNYSAVKYERLPSVAAFGDYGTIGTAFDHNHPTRTYGITVRVPVFDGGRRDARRTESASQLRQENIRTNDLRQQVELDVRLALESLKSAELLVKAAEEGLQQADNELAQAERRYKAGVGTSIEVTDAQNRVANARESRVNALFSHNLARIDLNSATGTIQSLVNSF
jgi:outer membrane protein TolC